MCMFFKIVELLLCIGSQQQLNDLNEKLLTSTRLRVCKKFEKVRINKRNKSAQGLMV